MSYTNIGNEPALMRLPFAYNAIMLDILSRYVFRFFLDGLCYAAAAMALASPIRRKQFISCLGMCIYISVYTLTMPCLSTH